MYRPSRHSGSSNPNAIPAVQGSLTGAYPSYPGTARLYSRRSYDRIETGKPQDCHEFRSRRTSTAIHHRRTTPILPEDDSYVTPITATQTTPLQPVLGMDDELCVGLYSPLTPSSINALPEETGSRTRDIHDDDDDDPLIKRIYSTKTSSSVPFCPERYVFYHEREKKRGDQQPEMISTESLEDDRKQNDDNLDRKHIKKELKGQRTSVNIAETVENRCHINYEEEHEYKQVN